MPNKTFLEEAQLYKREVVHEERFEPWRGEPQDYSYLLGKLYYPAINERCPTCESLQTYNAIEGANFSKTEKDFYRLDYECSGCDQHRRVYLLRLERDIKDGEGDEELVTMSATKVGQFPSWSIDVDKRLEGALGKDVELYKKGLINESQGYGIGAFAYFRRVAELVIDELLKEIPNLLESGEKEKYMEALKATQKEKNAADRIALVKDLIPKSLQPEGLNPMDVIYKALSEGMHEGTDQECLENADAVRESLVYLVNQISIRSHEGKEFSERMRKILDKKAKKNS